VEVNQNHVLKGGKTWQYSNLHPWNTISSPKAQEKLDLHRQPEKRTAKFNSSNNCSTNTSCCSDKGVVLARGVVGGGRYKMLFELPEIEKLFC